MALGPASRPRGPEDRRPTYSPAYPEKDAIRWELPVTVHGLRGVLVIRWFTGAGKFRRGAPSLADDGEMAARGQAAQLLEEDG